MTIILGIYIITVDLACTIVQYRRRRYTDAEG